MRGKRNAPEVVTPMAEASSSSCRRVRVTAAMALFPFDTTSSTVSFEKTYRTASCPSATQLGSPEKFSHRIRHSLTRQLVCRDGAWLELFGLRWHILLRIRIGTSMDRELAP